MPLSYDPQVIQILANAAQAFGRNVRERQRMATQREQFAQEQKMAEANFKLREENLALEQRKLELAVQKEASLQKSRQQRVDVRREELDLKRFRAGLETYKTLNPTVRNKADNVNKLIMNDVLSQPLVSDAGNDLRAYEQHSVTKLAQEVNRIKLNLSKINPLDKELHDEDIASGGSGLPAINELERQLGIAREALDIRQQQFETTRLSSISKYTQDPEIAASVESTFLTNLGKSIGALQVPTDLTSEAVPPVVQPGEQAAAPPTTEALTAAGKRPEAVTAPGGVPLTPLAQVISELNFDDQRSVERVAIEAARLEPKDAQNLLLSIQGSLSQEELLTFMRSIRKILRGK